MHIVTRADLGGAQSVIMALNSCLLERDDTVICVAAKNGNFWNILDNRVTKVPLESLQREVSLIKDLLSIFHFIKLRKKYNPDIVHLHSSKAGLLGRIAFLFSKRKIIYTVHGFDSILRAYRLFLPLEKMLKFHCKKIIAVSDYDRFALIRNNIKNVITIHNGIDDLTLKSYKPEKGVKDILQNLKNSNKKIIMSIARLSNQKKFDLFEEIASKMDSNRYAFVWIGNQQTVISSYDNVFCLGEIKDAAQYLRSADIFLLTSNYEGLPISIIEAQCFSIPVVSSDVGGCNEIIKNGYNGFCVENDSDKFVEKIRDILDNFNLYIQMSINSRKRYLEFFTSQKMALQYIKVYEE